MKRWFKPLVQIGLGAFVGSLLLENLTRFAIWNLMPRVHDVQFVVLISIISTIGGIFGGVSILGFLYAQVGRFKLAGGLTLIFGGIGLVVSLPQVVKAQQLFDQNEHPLIDALAYVGLTLVWSSALVIWGLLLLCKRSRVHLMV